MSNPHADHGIDLAALALSQLHAAGFQPEFSEQELGEVERVRDVLQRPEEQRLPNLRSLPWSSIDNDTSRDLDQIEVADRVAEGIKVQVAIADVAAAVAKGSALDRHAQAQTQTVYTAVRNFPMLPLQLSTDLTSLNENGDRLALVIQFVVTPQGELREEGLTRALVRNRAQLAYSRVGPWLEEASAGGQGAPAALRSETAPHPQKVSQTAREEDWLSEQLRLQDEAAQAFRAARTRLGALDFERAEADPIVVDGRIAGLSEVTQNRAMRLIEDFMVASNGVMARALRQSGRSGIQRVVRVPQRWDRLVALASERHAELPESPDPVALNQFLQTQRQTDGEHYPDLALAVIKLLGAGEYVLVRPDEDPAGHFGLAARDYAHSTAPNRRFSDLVTQRLLHAMLANEPPPYTDEELAGIADHCNQADKVLRKFDRAMRKRVMAQAMAGHIGEVFRAVVTGATSKGVYVRVLDPPFEGRVVQGEDGLDVGAVLQVRLLHTDPLRAFIDFAKL